MSYLDRLRAVVQNEHGVLATHIASTPVIETYQGQTVWDGIVEMFKLHGHPQAENVYAWAHGTDDPNKPVRYVMVLQVHPATSPLAAVRTALVQEYRERDKE